MAFHAEVDAVRAVPAEFRLKIPRIFKPDRSRTHRQKYKGG